MLRLQVTLMGDSSYQNLFEDAPEDTDLQNLWRAKFDDKSKSLVRIFEDAIPIIHGGKVPATTCTTVATFVLASSPCTRAPRPCTGWPATRTAPS